MRRERPEVMAPAGNAECLRAAVRAGADAVYFGLEGFNARARAENFRESDLGAVLRELHERAVRGYVTLNTLVFDDELDRLEQIVRACAGAGVDAVIVQDAGVAALVRAVAPSLPLHASTQMTSSDAASAAVARAWGAERVTLARELSLEQIALVAEASDIELEIFVHGALCISYSGQCFASLAFGGRSGNRGSCAQACRLPYDFELDGQAPGSLRGPYLLSPSDLDASTLVPALANIGVAALKIEGRLKGPDYVYAATRLYRQAVDAIDRAADATTEQALERARHAAQQIFSRGAGEGHLGGVDHGRLVPGSSSDHVGVPLGRFAGRARAARHECIAIELDSPLERGMGLLVLGRGAAPGVELGGRVWEIYDEQGRAVPRGEPGQRVLAWLGPESDAPKEELAMGARVFVTSDPRVSREIERDRTTAERRAPLELRLEGALGEKARLRARSMRDGREAVVTLEAATERARVAGSSADRMREKLGQLGASPFELERCEIALPADAFIPDAALKRARRAVVDALAAAASRTHTLTARTGVELRAEALGRLAANRSGMAPLRPGLVVLCRRADQVGPALDAGASSIALEISRAGSFPLASWDDRPVSPSKNPCGSRPTLQRIAVRIRERGAGCVVALPRIGQPGDRPLEPLIEAIAPELLLVRHLGAFGRHAAIPSVADHSLNVANVLGAAAVLALGAAAFTPALDLDDEHLGALLASPLGPFAEVLVYHHMPLFHTQHCPFAATTGAGANCSRCSAPCVDRALALRDRRGARHPVSVDWHGRATVHEERARSLVHALPSLQEAGVRRFRLELTTEPPALVREIVETISALVARRLPADEAERTLARALRPGGDQAISGESP